MKQKEQKFIASFILNMMRNVVLLPYHQQPNSSQMKIMLCCWTDIKGRGLKQFLCHTGWPSGTSLPPYVHRQTGKHKTQVWCALIMCAPSPPKLSIIVLLSTKHRESTDPAPTTHYHSWESVTVVLTFDLSSLWNLVTLSHRHQRPHTAAPNCVTSVEMYTGVFVPKVSMVEVRATQGERWEVRMFSHFYSLGMLCTFKGTVVPLRTYNISVVYSTHSVWKSWIILYYYRHKKTN